MNARKITSQIPEKEITPTVAMLLELIQEQSEEIQVLRDEIVRLKGQKPKPKIKPSNLDKKTKPPSEQQKTKPKRKKKSKTKDIVVHEEQKLHPDDLPEGSTFIDYKNFLVQDILFANWNVMYKRG